MDDDLQVRPEDAPHDVIEEDWLRQCIHEEFWSLILWHATTGQILDDGIFDSNGSALLIRGEY